VYERGTCIVGRVSTLRGGISLFSALLHDLITEGPPRVVASSACFSLVRTVFVRG
jgi:hypothetical protein